MIKLLTVVEGEPDGDSSEAHTQQIPYQIKNGRHIVTRDPDLSDDPDTTMNHNTQT